MKTKIVLLMIITSMILSCSTRKVAMQRKEQSLKTHQEEKHQEKQTEKESVENEIKVSGDQRTEVTIYPKGSFSYQPDQGFTGQASKVIWRGQQSWKMSQQQSSVKQKEMKKKVQRRVQQQQRNHSKSRLINQRTPHGLLIILLMVLALAIGYHWYQKRFSFV